MPVSDEGRRSHRTNIVRRTVRMEAFSDGVYAIAITLLVLDITVPPSTTTHVASALAHQWPIYMAYVVSFASIGAAWLAHSAITEYLDHADSLLLRLNLLLLFFVSVLPFPTHMVANFVHSQNGERVAVTIYGLNLLAISAMTSVLWHYALSEGLVSGEKEDDEIRALTRKVTPGLAFYAVAIAIGLAFPYAAVGLYLAIALFVLLPLPFDRAMAPARLAPALSALERDLLSALGCVRTPGGTGRSRP